jgi:hypothetical protein
MIWSRIKSILKVTGISFLFFLFFLVMTFPFQRLAPKVSGFIESGLQSALGLRASCHLLGFDLAFPLGIKWSSLSCTNSFGEPLLSFGDTRINVLPGYQKVSAGVDKGTLTLKMNAGLRSAPTRISGELSSVSLATLSPLISAGISRASPAVRDIRLEGLAEGSFEIPLRSFATEPGALDIEFKGLKLPDQSTLKMIGLKELPFKRAVIKATSSAGKLNFTNVEFLSDHLSGKVEGSMDLNDEFSKSIPNVLLKWSVQKSDALMSSPIGSFLANSPCPSPDAQGFCSRRITRMQDFSPAF